MPQQLLFGCSVENHPLSHLSWSYKFLTKLLFVGCVNERFCSSGGYSGAPVADGARASVYLSQSDDVAATTGCYFNNSARQISASAESRDEKLQEQLWEVSVDILKQKQVW